MIIFLDTEFTNLMLPALLSVGLATLDGREFYAELDLTTDAGKASIKAASDFVRNGDVLNQWGCVPGSRMTEWEIGRRTGKWLLEIAAEAGSKVEIAFDYSADYELMEKAIRNAGLWDQVREVVIPVNVYSITGTITGELAAEECFRELGIRGLRRHHALADALALRAAYIDVKALAWANPRSKSQVK